MSDARKEKLDHGAAWEKIKGFQTVFIGKGKKVLEFTPDETNRGEILKAAMGRSGYLRAPTVEISGKLIIGYNDEMYMNL